MSMRETFLKYINFLQMGGGTVGNTANNLVTTLKNVTDKSAK
jgi:hypothetical protein